MNYQQDNWTEWLSVTEFQYNNKRYMATHYIPFKLNFRRHLWKGNLTIKTELPRLEDFLEGLQKSWNTAKQLMEIAKEYIKGNLTRRDETHKD